MSLQCTRCGAPLTIPADYAVWQVRCQYCGFDSELPDRAARQAYAERQRFEAERAALQAAQTQHVMQARQAAVGRRERKSRTLLVALFGVPVLLMLGIGAIVYFVVASATSTLSPAQLVVSEPPATLLALVEKARSECPHVIDRTSQHTGTYSATYGLVKAECIRFLAVSPTSDKLTLSIRGPTGAVETRLAPTGTLDSTYCPKAEAEHQVTLGGSSELWIATLGCRRTFGSDPETTGKAKVAARLKELMTHGCSQISLANSTFLDDRKLTTPLDAGTCLDLIAATGVPDNQIKIAMSSPFGETIAPLPAPATSLEVPYCASNAGPHVIEVEGAVNGPYSVAIAICARQTLPKIMPKAGK